MASSSSLQKSLQQQSLIITPSTSSNSSQQQQQQNSLTLQLLSYNKQLQNGVTTTQPSPAGTFKRQPQQQHLTTRNISISSNLTLNGLDLDSGSISVGNVVGNTGTDISPISSTASFSSADTNQTLLNVIMASNQLQQQQQQQHHHQHLPTQQLSLPASPINSNFHRNINNNRSFRTKYSQFMIITPAVSIDRDFDYETLSTSANFNQRNTTTTTTSTTIKLKDVNNIGRRRTVNTTTIPTITTTNTCSIENNLEIVGKAAATTTTTTNATRTTSTTGSTKYNFNNNMNNNNNNNNNMNIEHIDIDDMSSYFNNANNNNFRMSLLQGSIDSGCSSDSGSFRSNYNPYLHTSRQHLLPKTTPQNFYTFSSWRWCNLICSAMRCFGAGGHSTHASYSTSFVRPPYQRTRSHGYDANSTTKPRTTPHKRLRPSSSFTAETAYEHFSAPFTNTTSTPRKTRDHMNNITYEL